MGRRRRFRNRTLVIFALTLVILIGGGLLATTIIYGLLPLQKINNSLIPWPSIAKYAYVSSRQTCSTGEENCKYECFSVTTVMNYTHSFYNWTDWTVYDAYNDKYPNQSKCGKKSRPEEQGIAISLERHRQHLIFILPTTGEPLSHDYSVEVFWIVVVIVLEAIIIVGAAHFILGESNCLRKSRMYNKLIHICPDALCKKLTLFCPALFPPDEGGGGGVNDEWSGFSDDGRGSDDEINVLSHHLTTLPVLATFPPGLLPLILSYLSAPPPPPSEEEDEEDHKEEMHCSICSAERKQLQKDSTTCYK